MNTKTLRTLVLIGLMAGTLDVLAACIDTYLSVGKGPDVVLKFIATGVFGKEAFAGGTAMVLFGLFAHYVIALGWTFLYYLLYKKFSFFSDYWIVAGFMLGIVIWLGMNKVIVPLSNVPLPPGTFDFAKAAKASAILVACMGLPIAYAMRRYVVK